MSDLCNTSPLFPYNYNPDYMQGIVYPQTLAHLQGGAPTNENSNLPPPSLPPQPVLSNTDTKTDKKTLEFMKKLMIDFKRNAGSKTAIKQLVQNKFSNRLSANGMTRAQWRNDFTATLDQFKDPKIKYMLVAEGDFKVRVYMTIEGTAKNTNSVQYLGVMGVYQLTGDNKHVKHITTITTPLTKENMEQLKQMKFGAKALQAPTKTQKGGDGYSVNPQDQINFMPTYPRYTDNCRPVFDAPELTGAAKTKRRTTRKTTIKRKITKKPTKKLTKKDNLVGKVVRVKLPNSKNSTYRWIVKRRDDGRYIVRAPKSGVLLSKLSSKSTRYFNKETLLPKGSRFVKRPVSKTKKTRHQRGGTAKCGDPSLNDNMCAQKYDFPKCD